MNKEKESNWNSVSIVADTPELQAWDSNKHHGAGPFWVIFDGKVYKNAWWVEASHCPGEWQQNPNHNAWRVERNATPQEIEKYGNPKDCSGHVPDDKETALLVQDKKTLDTYSSSGLKNLKDNPQQLPFKSDGSGYYLSFTSARVAKSVYNRYEIKRIKDPIIEDPIHPYITEICHYKSQLDKTSSDGSSYQFSLNAESVHKIPSSTSHHSVFKTTTPPKLASYITDWCQYDGRLDKDPNDTRFNPKNDAGRGFDLTKIDAMAYDRLIFSFMGIYGDQGEKKQTINNHGGASPVYPNGHITLIDFWGDLAAYRNLGLTTGIFDMTLNNFKNYRQANCAGLLGGLRELKKKNPALTLAFSIGGWTMSGYFSVVAADGYLRKTFISSIIAFFEAFPMFDAVDIDWEYPGGGGLDSNASSPDDGKNYTLLMRELRQALDSTFRTNPKEITIASSAVVEKMANTHIQDLVSEGLDNIYVMGYDFFGTGWSEQLGHHTNLKTYSGSPYSIESAVDYLVNKLHIARSKIHLGYANYGRSGANANLTTLSYDKNGSPLGSFEKGSVEFFDSLFNYLDLENGQAKGKNGFVLYTDEEADADLLYNEKEKLFISLDTPRTVNLKANYALENKLGGVFSWSGDQDNGLLANAAREGLAYKLVNKTFDMSKLYNKGVPIQFGKNK
jgi:chitinase